MTAPSGNTSANGRPTKKEWTVMILFAGDNDLAALLVSQVKAIKDAGFHEKVDVILHIDPSERGVPARLLRVNHKRRKAAGQRTSIGSGEDSFVRHMGEDTVRSEDVDANAGPFSIKMKEALKKPDTVTARESLENFLGYCRENHPAKNYMLFLFGHGLVVGNDAFLPDENPPSGVKLPDLGRILRDFARAASGEEGGETPLQLVGMHSCAMSAIEVAYELRGAAKYMIGAEGIAYVGSWPYQNLLVKIFKDLETARAASPDEPRLDIPELVEKLYFHALHNGTDFVYMGYSLDLALCSLEPKRYQPLTEEVSRLACALKRALYSDRGKEMILLAHWEAQSYWDENYTDLYDFCQCLENRCASLLDTLKKFAALTGETVKGAAAPEAGTAFNKLPEVVALNNLLAASRAVKALLEPTNSVKREDGGPIIRSKTIGSRYQYSHGLSVYFPWSKPLDDEPPPPPPLALQTKRRTPCGTAAGVIENYRAYAFSGEEEFRGETWLSFLEKYFEKTQRKSRLEEDTGEKPKRCDELPELARELRRSHAIGALEKPTGGTEKPTGGSGSSCTCPSIKNYPTEPLTLDGRSVEVRAFFSNEGLVDEKPWTRRD